MGKKKEFYEPVYNHWRTVRGRPYYLRRWRLSERATERLCFFLFGVLATRLLEFLARM